MTADIIFHCNIASGFHTLKAGDDDWGLVSRGNQGLWE